MSSFFTSRYGNITKLEICNYVYCDWMYENDRAIEKFEKWLYYSYRDQIYLSHQNGFSLFTKIIKDSNQYKFSSSKSIEPPFGNTQEVSAFISKILRETLSKNYNRFLIKNIFIVSKEKFDKFTLSRGIRFSVEVFKSGTFFIHFFPISKITSCCLVDEEYLNNLRIGLNDNSENMLFSLIELDRYRRIKIDLRLREDRKKAVKFIKNKKVIATFDYHFLAEYDKNTFASIHQKSQNEFNPALEILKEFSEKASFRHDGIALEKKPFKKIDLQTVSIKNNLKVGNGAIVSKQSAAYHKGCYRPINDSIIQQVYIGIEDKKNIFIDLLRRFNKEGQGNKLKKPIFLSLKEDNVWNDFEKPANCSNYIVAIFTKYDLPFDFFQPLFDKGISFQIYLGELEKFKMGNFVVKCIEKMGGKLAIVNDLRERDDTYFIGIDLGHSNEFSVLGMSVFNNHGELIFCKSINTFKGESLDPFPLQFLFLDLKSFLKDNGFLKPKRFIIHRDGKNHQYDMDRLLNYLITVFDVIDVDILEIIKSGYPVVGCYDSSELIIPNSGDYFLDIDNKYSILVTNIQSKEKNGIVKPIIIKHKFGRTSMKKLVEQVFWFTKVYTNNLYQSTRLPATTEKANNIVGTGKTKFLSSYLG